MISIINKLLAKTGYSIKRKLPNEGFPSDFSEIQKAVLNTVKPFTMTSNERIAALIDAVNYISRNKIEGSIVECGVWKGGSMMAAILALKHNKDESRQLYLYDTYEGKPPAEDVDKDPY